MKRLCSPRVSDIACIWQKLLELNDGPCGVDYSADFSNAFNTLKLRHDERQFAAFKGRNRSYVSKLVSAGLAAGPLLQLCRWRSQLLNHGSQKWQHLLIGSSEVLVHATLLNIMDGFGHGRSLAQGRQGSTDYMDLISDGVFASRFRFQG